LLRAAGQADLTAYTGIVVLAATVLDDTYSTTFPDTDHSSPVEPRFLTIRMSSRGRILVVAHTERDDTTRIITARRATRHERRFYEEG